MEIHQLRGVLGGLGLEAQFEGMINSLHDGGGVEELGSPQVQTLRMADLAKPYFDGRSSEKRGGGQIAVIPTLQTGTRNNGPHSFQMPLLFMNLEFHHPLARAYFAGQLYLRQPRHGEGVVDEFYLLQRRAKKISCLSHHARLVGGLEQAQREGVPQYCH
jgi:hypothetical protein